MTVSPAGEILVLSGDSFAAWWHRTARRLVRLRRDHHRNLHRRDSLHYQSVQDRSSTKEDHLGSFRVSGITTFELLSGAIRVNRFEF